MKVSAYIFFIVGMLAHSVCAELEDAFAEADKLYLNKEYPAGHNVLNQIIADSPGNVDVAVRALHKLCHGEFLELLNEDWPDAGIHNHLWGVAKRDVTKFDQLVSSIIQEAFLERGIFSDNGPIYIYTRDKLLETLRRRQGHYPLTPMERMSDEPMLRLLALRRAGLVSSKHPAVIDALTLLLFLRHEYFRFQEAAQYADELVVANNRQVDWLFARARLHHNIASPRSGPLFRELLGILERAGVDSRMGDVSQRVEAYTQGTGGLFVEPQPPLGPGWLGQMQIADNSPEWGRMRQGFVEGMAEQVDVWIQGSCISGMNQPYLSRIDGSGHGSTWNVLDQHLKSLDPKVLISLRKLQESKCSVDSRALGMVSATQSELLELFKRYPWAHTAHRALHLFAIRELEIGNSQGALRAFRDIMQHTANPEVSKIAQVGLLLAFSQIGNANKIETLLDRLDSDEEFPWMGSSLNIGEIRKRLAQGRSKVPAKLEVSSLSKLQPQIVNLPSISIWPTVQGKFSAGLEFVKSQFADEGMLLSTRNLLAWYDVKDTQQPVWQDMGRTARRDRSMGRVGSCQPILNEGTIYARWGYQADPYYLVAMDASSRKIHWTLDVTGPSDARKKIPLGNPILVNGLLYTASGWSTENGSGSMRLRVMCIEPSNGEVLWESDTQMRSGDRGMQGVIGDVLSVEDGEIYCTPGAEEVFRLDAKDGALEWAHRYPIKQFRHRHGIRFEITGSAPVLVKDTVLCIPRDCNMLLALDRNTGSLRWQSSLLNPVKIVSSHEDLAIVQGVFAIAGVRAKDGKVEWLNHVEKARRGQAVVRGRYIDVPSQKTLYRYELASGRLIESRDFPDDGFGVRNSAILENRLLMITDQPVKKAKDALRVQGSVDALWEVQTRESRIYTPKVGESGQGKFILHAGDRLQCLDVQSDGGLLWERFSHHQPREAYFSGGNIILLHIHRHDIHMSAFNLSDGHRSWDLKLLRGAQRYGRDGDLFFMKDNADRFTLVDLTKGKELSKVRVPRKVGHNYTGFGGGNIHMVRTVNWSHMFWMTWDAESGELTGVNDPLKGLLGDSEKRFHNSPLHQTQFGRRASFFVASTRQGDRTRGALYRGDYADRKIKMLHYDARLHDLKAPYLLVQDEERQREIKDVHCWRILSEDKLDYDYPLDLSRHIRVHLWQNGRLVANNHHKPKTLQVHDLDSKRILLTHKTEDPEKLEAVPAGDEHMVVYEFRRNQFFRATPYSLKTGLPTASTLEIDYWAGNQDHPRHLSVVGDLLLVANREHIQAWKMDGLPSL